MSIIEWLNLNAHLGAGEWSGMTLQWWWMLLLLPLPIVVWFLSQPSNHPSAHEDDSQDALIGALRAPFFAQVASYIDTSEVVDNEDEPPRFRHWWKWLLMGLAWVFLIVAISRPTLIGKQIPLPVAGRDIMVAMDLSGSMEARDLGVTANRLEVVKATADEFISRRTSDRVGLIFFSEKAYLQAPLTFDRAVVRDLLQEAQVGLTGQRTAIGDAIAIGLKRLREAQGLNTDLSVGSMDSEGTETNRNTDNPEIDNQETNDVFNDVDNVDDVSQYDSQVLILLTDGANNAGVTDPKQATAIAKKLGIKIYTIGVGGRGQIISTPFGQRMIASSDLDEASLTEIAQQTGGQYFRATDVQELQNIYQAIDQLEPINRDPKYWYPEVALYWLPALLSLLSMTLLMIIMSVLSIKREANKKKANSHDIRNYNIRSQDNLAQIKGSNDVA